MILLLRIVVSFVIIILLMFSIFLDNIQFQYISMLLLVFLFGLHAMDIFLKKKQIPFGYILIIAGFSFFLTTILF